MTSLPALAIEPTALALPAADLERSIVRPPGEGASHARGLPEPLRRLSRLVPRQRP